MRRRAPGGTRAIAGRSSLSTARALLETGAISASATHVRPPGQRATVPLQLRSEVSEHRELIGGLANALAQHADEALARSGTVALARGREERVNGRERQTERL